MFIGIDPGIKGAVGLLNGSGEYLAVDDIPTHMVEDKRRVDAIRLSDILAEYLEQGEAVLAIEKVHALPNQSTNSGFNFGETVGRIAACIEVVGCESAVYVRPQAWKKHFNLDKDKNKSLYLARELFPDAELHLKKHSDRAEALLIARWLYETR